MYVFWAHPNGITCSWWDSNIRCSLLSLMHRYIILWYICCSTSSCLSLICFIYWLPFIFSSLNNLKRYPSRIIRWFIWIMRWLMDYNALWGALYELWDALDRFWNVFRLAVKKSAFYKEQVTWIRIPTKTTILYFHRLCQGKKQHQPMSYTVILSSSRPWGKYFQY